jgi:solute carrier family 45, member 1/2/4
MPPPHFHNVDSASSSSSRGDEEVSFSTEHGKTKPHHPKIVTFKRGSSEVGRASLDMVNEQSPLIRPTNLEEEESGLKAVSPLSDEDFWEQNADTSEDTKSSWYLFLLTLGGLG